MVSGIVFVTLVVILLSDDQKCTKVFVTGSSSRDSSLASPASRSSLVGEVVGRLPQWTITATGEPIAFIPSVGPVSDGVVETKFSWHGTCAKDDPLNTSEHRTRQLASSLLPFLAEGESLETLDENSRSSYIESHELMSTPTSPTAPTFRGGAFSEQELRSVQNRKPSTSIEVSAPRSDLFWWFRQYRECLFDSPLITKSLTAGIVGGLGDLFAQQFTMRFAGAATHRSPFQLDWYRAWTVAAEGLFVSGPILHYAYDWMEETFTDAILWGGYTDDDDGSYEEEEESDNLSPFMTCASTFIQVLFDLVIMDSIFVMTLMVTSAVLQGSTIWQVLRELRTDYVDAVKVSCLSSLSMSPLQFFNFAIVPVEFRVLITNLQDVVWNAAVSYMAHRSREATKTGEAAEQIIKAASYQ